MKRDFDVVVVGGGHAGTEAAHAVARLGGRAALVTLKAEAIGAMSCNPAIGGLGKGHLVREIDALDGVMGRAADAAGIQFRVLNRRKGPAVQGPRAQADRSAYRHAVQSALLDRPGVHVLEAEVVDFAFTRDRVSGVVLADGASISAGAVVLTTGTFLRGVIHVGSDRRPGGRVGEAPSLRLAQRMDAFGLPLGRLKTGTPPRLNGRTIDWARIEKQPGDAEPMLFSFLGDAPALPQVPCGITHTNAHTHEIIRKNLSRSAMYGGHIDGAGPRYCPSIEDKVTRFADKASHQVFLEPEGLKTDTVYPNGISTSLPEDVQEAYVRTIRGLEAVEIEQPGYAIEYDYVDPRALNARLGVRAVDGLFLAGQINGTTGYEEAAGQGLVAGLNAFLFAVDRDPIVFSRHGSYLGVMIDDLITRGVSEPYRMFTSRAEYRLSLRADNADQRLTPLGRDAGLVGDARWAAFAEKRAALDAVESELRRVSFTPKELAAHGITVAADGGRRSAYDLLSYPDITFARLSAAAPDLGRHAPVIQSQIEKDALYARYLERQKRDADALARDEGIAIPRDFVFDDLKGLSNELKEKLNRTRPETLGQASRVEGMTPAALTLILAKLRQAASRQRVA